MPGNIVPGSIQLLYFSALSGDAKCKFCITACVEPKPRVLLINTQPSMLKRMQPELWEAQVVIDCASYGFLKYDSYVDCTDPFGIDMVDAERQIAEDPSRLKGMVNGSVLANIINAIANSTTIPLRQIGWMLDGLKNCQN